MEEKIGLIQNINCRLVKVNPDLIKVIVERTKITEDEVREMLRYNIFTIKQFSALAKLSVSHVLNKTRPSVVNGAVNTELDYCYPFKAPDNEGPKFIIRNTKSEKLLIHE